MRFVHLGCQRVQMFHQILNVSVLSCQRRAKKLSEQITASTRGSGIIWSREKSHLLPLTSLFLCLAPIRSTGSRRCSGEAMGGQRIFSREQKYASNYIMFHTYSLYICSRAILDLVNRTLNFGVHHFFIIWYVKWESRSFIIHVSSVFPPKVLKYSKFSYYVICFATLLSCCHLESS